ncbi:hypothetical protein GCM10027277_58730 [Pseudoduganella ginsengisoli]|uniref:Lipocalin-like domain-containing protein n=1 Tax=Pseudoduganella ginsengisoli TaxID=1462440 RepID=A0A6L6Q8Q6_9BURK|nr:hypothetical protein [Pseudoduganella ginsengisoli]MTW06167.1 hypothetical protein [Pseudoduganella ginsengisoli]
MYRFAAGFVLLTTLSACGGGSGGGDQGIPTQVAGALQKYEGVWIRPCAAHNRDTMTLAASNGGATLAFTIKTEYFANVDCTGAVVATGTYKQPSIVMQYTSTVKDANVKLRNGEVVTQGVDQGTTAASSEAMTFTGSGVTSSVVGGKTVWHITFSQGSTDVYPSLNTGVGKTALALRNGELLVLEATGTAGNTFDESSRLTH